MNAYDDEDFHGLIDDQDIGLDQDIQPDHDDHMNPSPQLPLPLDAQRNIQPTRLFYTSASHLNTSCTIQLVYKAITILFAFLFMVVYVTRCQQVLVISTVGYLPIWIMLLLIQALMASICAILIKSWLSQRNNFNVLAYKLGQVNQGQEPPIISPTEESKQVGILSAQIKQEIQKSSMFLLGTSRVGFFYFQILFFSGVFLLFHQANVFLPCEILLYGLMCAIIIISLYQFSTFYLIVVLVVLFSPIILFCLIVYGLKICCEKKKNQEFMEQLPVIKYKPNFIQGDPQCPICQDTYSLGDDLVVLPCSPLHHFHEQCIKSWIQAARNCPLCRKQIVINQ